MVARNANDAMIIAYCGGLILCVWWESRIWSQAVGFVCVRWHEHGFCRRENASVFFSLYINIIFYILLFECDKER